MFAQKAHAARKRIAQLGSPFVADGAVVLTQPVGIAAETLFYYPTTLLRCCSPTLLLYVTPDSFKYVVRAAG
jgi:hypothetical protein